MNAAAADRALFDESLCCVEEMPARFRAGELAESARLRALERAESLLRVIALVEEADAAEPEERGSVELGLQRVESKLNLVLELVGALVRQQTDLPSTVAVQWSRRGVRLERSEPFAPGTEGWLTLYPLPWLPQALELPVTALHCESNGEDARLWLALPTVPGGFQTALERHLFRRHRRAVALARRAR